MATVQIKVNMILERGAYLPMGALVDEETLPLNLRKSRYVCAPGELPEIVPATFAQPEPDEDDGEEDDDGDVVENPPSPLPPEPPEPPLPPPGSRRR